MLIEQLVVFFTIYESMPDRVERVDHLGIDAPQLHPAGCTLRVVFGSGVALPGAWFAPAGSPAKKARREMGAVSSAGGGWRVVYARWIVVGTVHWCLAAIAAPTGSPNPAPTFRGYRGLNGVLSCRWVGSGLRRLEWLWCVLVGACFLTGRGAAVAALLVGVSASVRAGT